MKRPEGAAVRTDRSGIGGLFQDASPPAWTESEAQGDVPGRCRKILKNVFGYDSFRPPQEEIVTHVGEGGDAFVLLPTGGGKSLCFQIPALVREGTGLVVSPLIALMDDQVSALRENGVRAAAIHSGLDAKTSWRYERELEEGRLDLVYVAPERVLSERFQEVLKRSSLSVIAIDEAHCVSQWGHDFRPEYVQLGLLAELFPGVPRMALTATADGPTRREIVEKLRLMDAKVFTRSFNRPNIRLRIGPKDEPRRQLLRFLREEHAGDSGIVYRLSRADVEKTAEWLSKEGIRALPYHAGLPAETRRRNQETFLREEGVVVVATIAFGMGIDKPDVRFVAHLDLPKSVEAYVQETGRAGRDGLPSNAWMVYGFQDIAMMRSMIQGSEAPEERKRVELQKLNALLGLCETASCRRQSLLSYFGETLEEPCGNCDTCLEPQQTFDGTEAAQKALSAVARTGQVFGVSHAIDVLTGEATEKVRLNGHDRLPTFGVGKDLGKTAWNAIFRQLAAQDLVGVDMSRYGRLHLTERSWEVLKGQRKVPLRSEVVREGRTARKEKRKASAILGAGIDPGLLKDLKLLRTALAKEHGVPPYIVFGDRSLQEMAQQHPRTELEFSQISGVGAMKAKRYGPRFLELLRSR
ncbi:MAG: DNA helicase RecQ [Fibrobacteria bacterium]|nr:DNA helicase RecQ [Fibrobacteria bacterium]